mmetsp:Transcript_20131/g.31104  ORF Transcript_20131/g.31104 Transcript_20131/m.31104 type:complete len:122 (+) Transcript_20131:14-379(+)
MASKRDNQQQQEQQQEEEEEEVPSSSITIRTIQEVIFHTAAFLKKEVIVGGTVTVLDQELGRMDISHNGAKLIVRVLPPTLFEKCIPPLVMGDNVVVTGILRKEQRRTFLEASNILKQKAQ